MAPGIAACASRDPERASSTEAAQPSQLDGEYAATDGPIASMTFADDGYALRRAGCTDADPSCVETGKYALDPAHTELTLTPAAGQPYRYPFSVRDLEASSSSITAPKSLAAGEDLTGDTAPSLLSPRVGSFDLATPSGSAPLMHVAWTVDLVEKIKLGCICQATLGPGCRPATFAACSPMRMAYCC
jgi:hypothetical protein